METMNLTFELVSWLLCGQCDLELEASDWFLKVADHLVMIIICAK